MLLLAVAGSHMAGSQHRDSDVDLKGMHLAPEGQLLGLEPLAETFDRLQAFEGTTCDLTTWEAGRALRLLLKGNGNVIEHIASPYQVIDGHVEALRALLPAGLSTACAGHYQGYFISCQREFSRSPSRKNALAAARVALTGAHLLQTGRVEVHLPSLADHFGVPDVRALIAARQAESAREPLSADASAAVTALFATLEAHLLAARERSALPRHPPDADALSRWLIHTRRAFLG